ncbi:MAG: DNA recombination protein RmuC [Bacteroidota bacterium]
MEAIIAIAGIGVGAVLVYLILKGKTANTAQQQKHIEELTAKLNQLNSEVEVLADRNRRANETIGTLQATLAQRDEDRVTLTSKVSALESLLQGASKTIDDLKQEMAKLRTELDAKQQLLEQARFRGVELEKENIYLKESLEKQKKDLEAIGEQFTKEFKLLADQILEDKSQRFTKMNVETIDRLLKPLDENIKQFQKQVQEVYEKESRERFSLGEKVKELSELNRTISQEAKNLTEALKGQVKTQGNWGEMILESILSKSGLVKGREYTVQESITDEEGKRFQPDVIISYPDNRKVVIDSKVSLLAYERYCSASTPSEQQAAVGELLQSVKRHIDGLSAKNYADMVETLDFVMMFIPIEPAFMLVMERDPSIWNYAYERRVLLISPTNLIAALKLIYDLWQREYRNRYAEEIAKKGGQLYDKFVNFLENFRQIGDSLTKAQKTYEQALGQLKEGKGNIILQAQQLRQLGAKTKKSIPDEFNNTSNELEE